MYTQLDFIFSNGIGNLDKSTDIIFYPSILPGSLSTAL